MVSVSKPLRCVIKILNLLYGLKTFLGSARTLNPHELDLALDDSFSPGCCDASKRQSDLESLFNNLFLHFIYWQQWLSMSGSSRRVTVVRLLYKMDAKFPLSSGSGFC